MKIYDYEHYLKEIEKVPVNNNLFHFIGIATIILLFLFVVSIIQEGIEELFDRPSLFLVPLLLICLFTVSVMNGGFKSSGYNGESKDLITNRYLQNAKQVEKLKTVPIYSLNTGNSEKIEGNISGAFLFVSGSVKTKSERVYKYVVKETDGYQFLELNSEYKIDNDKQIYINESSDNPSLVIKSYHYEDERFDKLLSKEKIYSWGFSNPLKKDKFIFNVPKGTVITSFKAE